MRKLKRVSIWVTTDCNLRCKYCYVSKNKEMISAEKAEELVKYLKEKVQTGVKINFHGGEPTLNLTAIEIIVQGLKEFAPVYSFTTNGLIFNQQLEQLISNNKFMISVSIDGKQEVHNLNRVTKHNKPSYEQIIKNIQRYEAYTNLRIRMTVTPETVSELYENYMDIYLNISPRVVFIPDITSNWSDEQVKVYIEQFRKILAAIPEREKNNLLLNYQRINFKRVTCDGGTASLHVQANGDFYPCIMSGANKIDKIGSLDKGINDNHFEELRKINSLKLNQCLKCGLRKHCRGVACKYINNALTGSYIKYPESYCKIHIAEYFLLKSEGVFK